MEEMCLKNYAYLGDAVWEIFIREKTVKITDNAKKLHKITTDKVKAGFQAELLHFLEEYLTDDEKELARRGRNLSIPIGRRQIQAEYRPATASEVLVGWWYKHDKERLDYIFNLLEQQLEF